jgi:hypothetical protein
MPRRIAVAALEPPLWTPPGVDPRAWRVALAEDVLDVLALMAEVDAAVAVTGPDEDLLAEVGWPGMRTYVLDSLDSTAVLTAAAADGYQQGVMLAADAPDLPGMLIAKLLRPLTSHPVAVAPVLGQAGLLGLSAVLPAPSWLPPTRLDESTPQALRRYAPQPSDVAAGTGWHRLRSPADLAHLDPRLEGWDNTRALLTLGSRP